MKVYDVAVVAAGENTINKENATQENKVIKSTVDDLDEIEMNNSFDNINIDGENTDDYNDYENFDDFNDFDNINDIEQDNDLDSLNDENTYKDNTITNKTDGSSQDEKEDINIIDIYLNDGVMRDIDDKEGSEAGLWSRISKIVIPGFIILFVTFVSIFFIRSLY